MSSTIKKLYLALLKPTSVYLSNPFSNAHYEKNRIIDFEKGQYQGIDYKLETVIKEKENPFKFDSGRNIFKVVREELSSKKRSTINFEEIREKLKQQEKEKLFSLFPYAKIGLINHLLTRPPYKTENKKTYLILTGLAQDNLEKTHLEEIKNCGKSEALINSTRFRTKYLGTPYQLFLFGLAEERFRNLAEKEAEENKQNPELNQRGFEWMKNPEQLMSQKVRFPDEEVIYVYEYHLINNKAIPVLAINDFLDGHEAAKNCIDFALNDGQLILKDKMCLLRHRPLLINDEDLIND